MTEKTVQLHCRVPESVYKDIRNAAKGKHALGGLVSEALVAYLSSQNQDIADTIAEAVLRKLKERL